MLEYSYHSNTIRKGWIQNLRSADSYSFTLYYSYNSTSVDAVEPRKNGVFVTKLQSNTNPVRFRQGKEPSFFPDGMYVNVVLSLLSSSRGYWFPYLWTNNDRIGVTSSDDLSEPTRRFSGIIKVALQPLLSFSVFVFSCFFPFFFLLCVCLLGYGLSPVPPLQPFSHSLNVFHMLIYFQ